LTQADDLPEIQKLTPDPKSPEPGERIADAVYATDGTLGGVPVLEIAAPSARSL